MVQGFLHHALHIVRVASRLPYALTGFLQGELLPVSTRQSEAVDIVREGRCQSVGVSLLFFRESLPGASEVPLIGCVRHIETGDGAPAHGPEHRVAVVSGRADLFKIRGVEFTVPAGAEHRALGPAAAHAAAEERIRVAGKQLIVVPEKADGGLQVRDAGGGAVFPAAASRNREDHALLRVVRDTAVAEVRIIGFRRGHGGVPRRVDRKDHGSRVGDVASALRVVLLFTGPGAVSVIRSREIGSRHKESHRLILFVRGRRAVRDAHLPVDIILRVILPLCHVHHGQAFDHFRREFLLCGIRGARSSSLSCPGAGGRGSLLRSTAAASRAAAACRAAGSGCTAARRASAGRKDQHRHKSGRCRYVFSRMSSHYKTSDNRKSAPGRELFLL